jgi:hypothetical protein
MRTLSFRQSACILTIAISMGLVLTLSGTGRLFADESLDQLLATAMESHPDIVAAKAKVTLAEAELNAARLQVARQLIALWGEKHSQSAAVNQIQQEINVTKDLPKRDTLTQSLQDARVKSEMTETVLKYLTEKKNPAEPESKNTAEAPKELQEPSGPIVEEIKKEFRTKTIQLEFSDTPLNQVIDFMKEDLKYPIYLDKRALNEAGLSPDTSITMDMQKTPLPAVIQAFQDQNPGTIFVIRDYGILLTTIDQAQDKGYYPALEWCK